MTLGQKLVALHRALSRRRIPHAFGGAIALGFATRDPRGTSDIDVNIFLPADEPDRALAALPTEIKQPSGTPERLTRDGQIRLWWDQTPVDLFLNNLPIHEQAEANARSVPYEGTRIPVLGPVELTVFKMMFDRTRDWADIEAMLEANSIDLEEVRATLETMLPSDDPRFTRLDEAVRAVKKRPG